MDTTRADYVEGRFNEVGDVRKHTTNDNQKFKKEYQTVGRPPVTDHDINDEYMRNPPNSLNIPRETSAARKAPGLKEGAREETGPNQDGVFGDAPTSRIHKDVALGDLANENTVHPNSTS
ncbi:hypothetical protein DAEQUDRAFT_679983 [Daedalea quercina L-15889]|uniref:Uncharacterized protein n=1 Tax=Daedalea quercina L-15889 TaxID=1314783 RepID=A0A165KWA3_9APHY|nr:hypothetical protein DAEQUDRAFT_679983 [Daedalea quercina L-15889]